jgi:hypothetical protein
MDGMVIQHGVLPQYNALMVNYLIIMRKSVCCIRVTRKCAVYSYMTRQWIKGKETRKAQCVGGKAYNISDIENIILCLIYVFHKIICMIGR